MARRKIFEYEVTGRLSFPFDMLRYDQAWPARGEDAAYIEASAHRHEKGPFRVRLYGLSEPTFARWKSFSWTVDPTTVSWEPFA